MPSFSSLDVELSFFLRAGWLPFLIMIGCGTCFESEELFEFLPLLSVRRASWASVLEDYLYMVLVPVVVDPYEET